MNYAKIIQQKIYDGITDPPVRAAIYARVSTDNEGQKESLSWMMAYLERMTITGLSMSLF